MNTQESKLKLAAVFLRILLLVTTSWSLRPGEAQGQTIPPLVNYQGRLSNPDGSPLPTADYMLSFSVFDAPANGNLIWGPQIFDSQPAQGHGAKIPVVQGYFNVMLGPVDTTNRALSDAFNGSNRFVEITVSNRPPIAPRQQILATPFAFQAANAAKLGGYDWSAVFGTNDPVNGKISLPKLAARQIGTNVVAGGLAVSLPTGFWESNVGMTLQEVSNMVVTVTTTGRPVMVFLSAATNTPLSLVGPFTTAAEGPEAIFVISRDGNDLSAVEVGGGYPASNNNNAQPPNVICQLDIPPAGNHTYRLRVAGRNASSYVRVYNSVLIAFEF